MKKKKKKKKKEKIALYPTELPSTENPADTVQDTRNHWTDVQSVIQSII